MTKSMEKTNSSATTTGRGGDRRRSLICAFSSGVCFMGLIGYTADGDWSLAAIPLVGMAAGLMGVWACWPAKGERESDARD